MAHVELELKKNRILNIRLFDSDRTEVHDIDLPVALLDAGFTQTLRTSDRFKLRPRPEPEAEA